MLKKRSLNGFRVAGDEFRVAGDEFRVAGDGAVESDIQNRTSPTRHFLIDCFHFDIMGKEIWLVIWMEV